MSHRVPAVRAVGLSKEYRLGENERHKTLRESITGATRGLFRRRPPAETMWALRDVCFEVERGEVLGVIGPNGAGKSTLLKILARITKPSEGRVETRGRVGSLLEVGTGFHPELTGRENIFLNGAILGMRGVEIRQRFDEMVAFAEIERFLDTPVKRYSTGMYLRLAFAVAAHLDPDILLVDEVLAVGDAAFQKKCLGKMNQVVRSGRTILFVSHNFGAIEHLCNKAILIEGGRVAASGNATDVVSGHVERLTRSSATGRAGAWDLGDLPRQPGLEPVLRQVVLRNESGALSDTVPAGSRVRFEITYDSGGQELADPHFAIRIGTVHGHPLVFLRTQIQRGRQLGSLPASGQVRCTVDRLPLAPGTYSVTLGLTERGLQLDLLESVLTFHVQYADFFGTGSLPQPNWGPVLVDCSWRVPEGSVDRLEPMSRD